MDAGAARAYESQMEQARQHLAANADQSIEAERARRVRTAESVGSFVDGDWDDEPLEDLPYHRYCWPPL